MQVWSWVLKIPWRRAWQPTPVFLSEESHGQRSLVVYSLYSHKELDMTKVNENTHMHPDDRQMDEYVDSVC